MKRRRASARTAGVMPRSQRAAGLEPRVRRSRIEIACRSSLTGDAEEPFEFAPAYERATFVTLGGTSVPVLSLPDLIALKRSAGRPKDLSDAEALEEIASAQSGTAR